LSTSDKTLGIICPTKNNIGALTIAIFLNTPFSNNFKWVLLPGNHLNLNMIALGARFQSLEKTELAWNCKSFAYHKKFGDF